MEPNITEEAPESPQEPQQEHPEQEAHGGSMAPGLVDDDGQQLGNTPEPPD